MHKESIRIEGNPDRVAPLEGRTAEEPFPRRGSSPQVCRTDFGYICGHAGYVIQGSNRDYFVSHMLEPADNDGQSESQGGGSHIGERRGDTLHEESNQGVQKEIARPGERHA